MEEALMIEKAKLLKRIEALERAVKDINDTLATLLIKSDKELYETIMNTDENSELYNEEDIKW